MRHRAITITEVCVLLFSAGVLTFGLFTWAAHDREVARRNSCQCNLKQIGLAFDQYAQDYNGRYPRYDAQNVGQTISGPYVADYWYQALQPYTKGVSLFLCPKEPNYGGTDYFLNIHLSGGNRSKLNHSARTVLLAEGPDTSPASLATASAPVRTGTPPAFSRHLNGSNYSFADGHCKWLPSQKPPETGPVSDAPFSFGT